MRLALSLAETAAIRGEVPVGAIIVRQDKIISTGFNQRETSHLACSHAEIEAISAANIRLKNWRLSDCTLYVTLEPCIMCAGAIQQSRLTRVVYGTKDPKGGAMGSLFSIHEDQRLNHQVDVETDVLQPDCSQILKDFFSKRR
jgi:tRNA(adenine34) deaminase